MSDMKDAAFLLPSDPTTDCDLEPIEHYIDAINIDSSEDMLPLNLRSTPRSTPMPKMEMPEPNFQSNILPWKLPSTPMEHPTVSFVDVFTPVSPSVSAPSDRRQLKRPASTLANQQEDKKRQRCYEKNYRDRKFSRRSTKGIFWVLLEVKLRHLLIAKAPLCLRSYQETEEKTLSMSTACQELHDEAVGLEQDKIFFRNLFIWLEVLRIWGGEAKVSSFNRKAMNTVGSTYIKLQPFTFVWGHDEMIDINAKL